MTTRHKRGISLLRVLAFHQNQRGELRTTEVAPLSTTGGGKPGQGYPAVVIFEEDEVKSGTLTARYGKGINTTVDEPVVIVDKDGQTPATGYDVEVRPVAMRGRSEGAELEWGDAGEPSYALRTGSGGSSKPMVACVTGDKAHTLTSEGADASEDGTGRGTPIVAGDQVSFATGVRRLTPMECERLQGFPDRHTEGQSDSARYRQLGNAVAVPVVEWIARRLVEVDSR